MGVGFQLKSVLRNKNMTIKQLAEKSGISINTLYSITKRDPERVDAYTIATLADALDVLPSDLMRCFPPIMPKLSIMPVDDFSNIEKAIQSAQNSIKNAVIPIQQVQKSLVTAFGVSNADIQSFAKAYADIAREKRNLTEEEYAQEYSKWLAFYEENGIPVENEKLPLPIDAAAFAAFLNNLEPEGQAKALQCIAMLGDIQDKYIRTTNQKPKTD